ncbi:MAG: hypothetical protein MUE51_08815 [Thermoleophilia bacterium]|jgi:hypothetical protein|nr:hypothetical protein [Thermoleophilia bacterium]
MTGTTALLLGLVVGVVLSTALVWLATRNRSDGARRRLVGSPAQRLVVLWAAAGIASLVVASRAAGADDGWTGLLLVVALVMAAQGALLGLLDRGPGRRSPTDG